MFEWIRNIRQRQDSPPDSPNTEMVYDGIWNRMRRRLFNRDSEVPPLYEDASGINRTPNIYTTNVNNESQTIDNSIELEDRTAGPSTAGPSTEVPVRVQLTGLPEIRGDNFEESSNAVLKEMDLTRLIFQ